MSYSEKAEFARENLDLREASGVDNARWESFQWKYLNNETRLGIDVKARQIAWSFTAALDAVIDSFLYPGNPHIFVSINLDEAKEKIRYAKSIHDAIDPKYRIPTIRESQTEIEYSNGSRLISHPCRPVRGKAKARVYLDEMAHYAEGLDRQIYLAALPSTTKGDGYMRIGSSPMGARGLFWEIASESMKRWPGFQRSFIPWWHVRALCSDISYACKRAPEMLTQERVETFGTKPLIEIFENMFEEDFKQEYECEWVDEAVAWISWDVIKRNQKTEYLWWHAKSVDQALILIDQVRLAIKRKEIEPVLVGGIDVGRKRDLTEMMVLGRSTTGDLPLRLSISLDRVEYDSQEHCFKEVIDALPFTQILIDNNGIGAQLAENLHKKTRKAREYPFTNASKELLAVEARIQAENGKVPLPMDRDIAYQIHSIRKTVSGSKLNVFDAESNQLHHADKFWAWALAIYSAKRKKGTGMR